MFKEILGRVSAGEDLAMNEMASTVEAIMQGQCTDSEIGLLLTALRAKGETAAEIAGAATAMRKVMVPVQNRGDGLLDTCGTGGDASGTFNISTAAAIVTAAAGVPVAKHGNRSITSKTGSADVLEVLGVNVDAEVPTIEACLEQVGIGFCFAPRMHPAMRHVGPVRRQLGFPTIFNLLGPLCNPAGAPYQLLGVGRPEVRTMLAEALALLGTLRSVIVSGADGLDEVTLNGPTNVIEVGSAVDGDAVIGSDPPSGSSAQFKQYKIKHYQWTPADFGLPSTTLEGIRVENADESAEMIRTVLSGKPGTARDIVVANAAAGIWTAGRSEDLLSGVAKAVEAIDSGAAGDTLARWVELSNA